jgi:hypothetical protein
MKIFNLLQNKNYRLKTAKVAQRIFLNHLERAAFEKGGVSNVERPHLAKLVAHFKLPKGTLEWLNQEKRHKKGKFSFRLLLLA